MSKAQDSTSSRAGNNQTPSHPPYLFQGTLMLLQPESLRNKCPVLRGKVSLGENHGGKPTVSSELTQSWVSSLFPSTEDEDEELIPNHSAGRGCELGDPSANTMPGPGISEETVTTVRGFRHGSLSTCQEAFKLKTSFSPQT